MPLDALKTVERVGLQRDSFFIQANLIVGFDYKQSILVYLGQEHSPIQRSSPVFEIFFRTVVC